LPGDGPDTPPVGVFAVLATVSVRRGAASWTVRRVGRPSRWTARAGAGRRL